MTTSKYRDNVIDLFKSFGLDMVFSEPSRKCSMSESCIDNIFLTNNWAEKLTVNPHISDIMVIMTTSKYRDNVIDLFKSFGLDMVFSEPSRKCSMSESCIDNIFLTNNWAEKLTVNPHISDIMVR
ncbi:hypothetical protein QE152_g9858 [Popillia japonica]|uniref:Uncharacterized protein n=1 Tax=Popillia japonica TaxID=7064 RepID=A0AAW1LX88_POPJA